MTVGGVRIKINNGNTAGLTHLKLFRSVPASGTPGGHFIYVICDNSWIDWLISQGGVERTNPGTTTLTAGGGLYHGYNGNVAGVSEWVGPPQWRINGNAGPPLPLPGPNGYYQPDNKTFFVRPSFTNFV